MYLDQFHSDFERLCRENKVLSLDAFGSVLTSLFNDKSDIDLLVDIDADDPLKYGDCYFNLKFGLEDLLKRPVDLLENRALRNPILRKTIEASKKRIYPS